MLEKLLPIGIVIVLALLAAGYVSITRPRRHVREELLNTWLHSYEEDQGDVRVYRPRGFPFPPAFGRDGFAILRGGEFIQIDIGPADETVEIPGTWKLESPDVLFVTLRRAGNNGRSTYRLQILSLSAEMLTVQYL